MLLSRRILVGNLLLLGGMLALGGVMLLSLFRVHDQVEIAVEEYSELRLIQGAMLHIAQAENLMIGVSPSRSEIGDELGRARDILQTFLEFQRTMVEGPEVHENREVDLGTRSLAAVNTVIQEYSPADAGLSNEQHLGHLRLLGGVLSDLNHLAEDADKLVARTHSEATSRVRRAILGLSILSVAVILLGTLVGISQYRHVIRPLSAIRQAVRTVAGGGLSTRVPERGDAEFLQLASDFNGMARELDSLYRGLEEKVAIKSRELVQSERLASVGFLAAGVAHEINNPLNIISGYAELSHRKLRGSSDPQAVEDALKTLQIIRDETFRCKGITEKLLSLSTPADGRRDRLSLKQAAEDVTDMLRHMKRYRERDIQLNTTLPTDSPVLGSENELKQVLINLMVNAIEATEPTNGRVWVTIDTDESWVRLSVHDNGRGMTPEVCQRVFEPFFSGKRVNGNRGIGLGLSISHAIITGHGGRLSAQSDGPERGSRFTIELPRNIEGAVS